jgi:hypothetical protein
VVAETLTGLEPWFGISGINYVHEITRAGVRVLAEVTNEAVTSTTDPITVSILRRQLDVAGNPMRGIPGTWSTVAGLDDLFAVVFTQSDWADSEANPNATRLKEGERVIMIPDVPAAGGVDAYEILTTDRVEYTDAVYGLQAFEILEVRLPQGPGVAWMRVRYAREAGPVGP